MERLRKYPRTRHLMGSGISPDDDPRQVPLSDLDGHHLVVEEKMDGANAGVSFSEDGRLLLQSRGHFLTGGPRERHFDRFKQWAHGLRDTLFELLGARYVMYGEWLYAKHTIFYDALPHHFMEFDILDKESGGFLSTQARRNMLEGAPVVSVMVLAEGTVRPEALEGLIGRSRFKTAAWKEVFRDDCEARGLDHCAACAETDMSDLMEGLYVKIEENEVLGRYKLVRKSFLESVRDSGSHWMFRPVIPNRIGCAV